MIRKYLATTLCLGAGIAIQAQAADAKVDFITEVKPIFEATCMGCHNEEKSKGDYRMDQRDLAFEEGDEGPTITPGDAEDSSVYWTTALPHDDDLIMPPKEPLTVQQQETIRDWINQGAEWPEGVELVQKQRLKYDSDIAPILKKGGPFSASQREKLRLWAMQGAVWPEGFSTATEEDGPAAPADDLALVEKMRAAILAGTPEKVFDEMKAYENTIPKTGVKYEMLPIPGGDFLMGSPDSETDRKDDEGPQHKVNIKPFWMGKFEVTWDMYQPFMITSTPRNKDGSPRQIEPDADAVDIVSSPTAPYTEMSFNMGLEGFPAISMTQHAANKFCQWLSAQTGHYYRLPTEAEWEYACRAGTTGPFSCPEDQLADFAVFEADFDNPTLSGYAKVGTKKPNPWGLHDMHGNVWEWVLDQYVAGSYAGRSVDVALDSPLVSPTELYPRVVRGGSWYDGPADARSARRFPSEENWKQQDPQLPKSIWYHTDALWLGFRLVRPLETPDTETMHQLWNLGRPEDE